MQIILSNKIIIDHNLPIVECNENYYSGQYIMNENKCIPHGLGRLVLNNKVMIEGFFQNGKPVHSARFLYDGAGYYEGKFIQL